MKKIVLISCLLCFMIFMPAQEKKSELSEDIIQPSELPSLSNPRGYYPDVDIPILDNNELRYYVATHVKYPEKALDEGKEGRVLIKFTIEADGSLSNFQILKDEIGYGAGENVVEILKEFQGLEPTRINGEPVRSFFSFPVYFKLP